MPPLDRATAYARDVTERRIVAGPLVRAACRRHLEDLERWAGGEGAAPYWWDVAASAHIIRFFEEELVLADVLDEEGDVSPFVVQPWQAFVLGSLFGWKKANGYRRFRTGYLEVGKGNGKTPMAAGVGLYCLVADKEPYPEVYSGAVGQKQALLIWTDAVRMREHGPRIKRHVDKSAHVLTTKAGGRFEAISSEYRGLEGKRPHCALIDEVHEHPNAQVVTKMRRGTKGRKQALIMEITNSGYDKTSICFQHHEYSRKIVEGMAKNDQWFAYVCGLDDGDAWDDPTTWAKSNPNLGISIQPAYLEEAVMEAKGMPAAESDVRRLNFCEWVDRQSNFIPSAAWLGCLGPIDARELVGYPVVGGLDLGESDDMSALALLWRLSDERFHAKIWYWTCAEAIKTFKFRPWEEWKRAGALTVTPGNITDYLQVKDDVSDICRKHGVKRIAFDRRSALQMSQELQGDGFTMIEQPQGFNLSEATKKLGTLVKAAGLTHDGEPVTDWQMSNLSVLAGRNREIRPIKMAGDEKVDGAVALIMALVHGMLPAEATGSVYDKREVLVL
jgi:phage terminase large subunit-like protein